jgi:hypothetical protein
LGCLLTYAPFSHGATRTCAAHAYTCTTNGRYLELPLVKPVCGAGQTRVVPLTYHAIDAASTPPPAVLANVLRNPEYKLNYHNDSSAYVYVLDRCGKEVAEAFRCFLAPAYRADVFRFCAMLKDGGVYVLMLSAFAWSFVVLDSH